MRNSRLISFIIENWIKRRIIIGSLGRLIVRSIMSIGVLLIINQRQTITMPTTMAENIKITTDHLKTPTTSGTIMIGHPATIATDPIIPLCNVLTF